MSLSSGRRGRSRGAVLAVALGVSLLGGALPPAALPTSVYAQSSTAGDSAPSAGSAGDQPSTRQPPPAVALQDQTSGNSAPTNSGSEPARADTPPSSPFSAPQASPFSTAQASAFAPADPSPAALWYAQQWQQAQALAMAQQGQALALAQQWQLAQATLAAWSQRALAASVFAQQAAAAAAPTTPARIPTPATTTAPPPPIDRVRIQQSLVVDGQGLCGLAAGHVCQVGGDLTGSTVTPLGTSVVLGPPLCEGQPRVGSKAVQGLTLLQIALPKKSEARW
jgi:hypothetical protein